MTPLDFRLTAATQFRLLALLCSTVATAINDSRRGFDKDRLITSHVISRSVFQAELDKLVFQFQAEMLLDIKTSRIAQLTMLIIEQSRMKSALHTNTLEYTIPGVYSDYVVVNTFYPLHDDASVSNFRFF